MQCVTTLIRQFLSIGLLAVAASASAQTYPTKPIEWVVSYHASGGTDVVAHAGGRHGPDPVGLEAIPSTPAQMEVYAKSEREKWGTVIRSSGTKLD